MNTTLRLVVSLGDPAGIGPEVVEKALPQFLARHDDVALVLTGPETLARGIVHRVLAHPLVAPRRVECAARLQVDATGSETRFSGPIGLASAEGGVAALTAFMRAIQLAKNRDVDALVTAPISKEALALAGCADRGHTEILARELGTGPTAMAFVIGGDSTSDHPVGRGTLRVVLVSAHVSLRQAIGLLSVERVVATARLFESALREQFAIAPPRLALAGLNPHAGEKGLMGDEETLVLEPAVVAARAAGVDLAGPYPADSVFRRATLGEFDGVVALYHDQALIPLKLLAFGQATNVTLGLSVPRTSPDHGTAFDLAGQGRAHPEGMLAALETAAHLAGVRR